MLLLFKNLPIRAKIFGNALIILVIFGMTAGYALYAIAVQDIPLTKILTIVTTH